MFGHSWCDHNNECSGICAPPACADVTETGEWRRESREGKEKKEYSLIQIWEKHSPHIQLLWILEEKKKKSNVRLRSKINTQAKTQVSVRVNLPSCGAL